MVDTTKALPLAGRLRLRIMIATGLVMFVFTSMHLINLALGLISLQVMEDWRGPLSGVWSRFLPLKILLQLSLVVHFILALISLYLRNTLRVPAYDMAQMLAGVLIIPLLAKHVFGVMAIHDLGLYPTYALVLSQFWVASPVDGLQQVTLLVVAWIHGAIGVFTWLRARDASARVMNLFYPFVVALPILAMLGYVEAGRQVIPVSEGGLGIALADDPNVGGPKVSADEISVILERLEWQTWVTIRVSLGLVALVLLMRAGRLYLAKQGRVQVTYQGRRPAAFEARTGLTLLEMVRENDLPHASKCRGRGRCGTCRVRIIGGQETLDPPSDAEADVLARWNAGPDERLACQMQPQSGKLVVERVVEPDYSNLGAGGLKPASEGAA